MRKSSFVLTVLSILFLVSQSFAATTMTLKSTPSLTAYITSGGSIISAGAQIMVGDTSVNTGVRGFLSFDISTIPSGSNIVSATLRAYQEAVNGTPYTDLGNVIVDHLDYGATLDAGDYNIAALQGNVGTLSNNTVFEFKTLDVASIVQNDITMSRTRSQYRMLFPANTDSDGVEDATFFTGALRGNEPELVITYEEAPAVLTAVPTLTEWGMVIFLVFAGLGSVYYLRRQRETEK